MTGDLRRHAICAKIADSSRLRLQTACSVRAHDRESQLNIEALRKMQESDSSRSERYELEKLVSTVELRVEKKLSEYLERRENRWWKRFLILGVAVTVILCAMIVSLYFATAAIQQVAEAIDKAATTMERGKPVESSPPQEGSSQEKE